MECYIHIKDEERRKEISTNNYNTLEVPPEFLYDEDKWNNNISLGWHRAVFNNNNKDDQPYNSLQYN